MTTFLWILAVIGAVVLALTLAYALSRLSGPPEPAAQVVDEPGSRYARDNVRSYNPGAIGAAFVIVGGIVALVLGLSLT
jgi:hypothetical protein